MAKKKVNYICGECGFSSPGWLGKCPQCSSWNTLQEVIEERGGTPSKREGKEKRPSPISEIVIEGDMRKETGIGEFDRVLGGGLVGGSVSLVAGEPGIGKSTLLLQVCASLARSGERVMYVSGEESEKQVKMRAERLGINGENIFFLSETLGESISAASEEVSPSVIVVDSIQTLTSEHVAGAPGSISQVRESTYQLSQSAKGMGIALLLVGHVTKEGAIAGPKLLEHMVDVVLYFEGEKGHPFRVLKGVKNRFGSVSEIGIFEMTGKGLMEVTDPSGLFINGSKSPVPGMVVFPSLSGSRTMMVEVQALVSKTYLPVPRRVVVGLDQSRSQIVTTIVEKHCGIKLYNSDLYLNVAGGMRIFDTGGDLPLAMAIMSGALDKPIQAGLTGFGEVGLGGEVRPVPLPRQRVAEAVRMGFRSILVPSRVAEELNHNEKGVEIIPVTTVRDLKRRVI